MLRSTGLAMGLLCQSCHTRTCFPKGDYMQTVANYICEIYIVGFTLYFISGIYAELILKKSKSVEVQSLINSAVYYNNKRG